MNMMRKCKNKTIEEKGKHEYHVVFQKRVERASKQCGMEKIKGDGITRKVYPREEKLGCFKIGEKYGE